MSTRPVNSEAHTLEMYRVALNNVELQSDIASAMEELGYNTEKIGEGKLLLEATRSVYNLNITEDDETSEASENFKAKQKELLKVYRLHRKKAKVVFRNDVVMAEKLQLLGEVPRSYVGLLEATKKFYGEVTTSVELQNKLARLAMSADSLSQSYQLVDELEQARLTYLREVGESQETTRAKDKAMANMSDWMSEFYAVARIALEDKPQLLEVLGKLVK